MSDVASGLTNRGRALPRQHFPHPPPGAPLLPIQRVVSRGRQALEVLQRGVVHPVGARPGQVGGHLPVPGGEIRQLVGGEAVQAAAGGALGQHPELVPAGALPGGERRRGGRPPRRQGALTPLPLEAVQLQQMVELGDAGRRRLVDQPGRRWRPPAGPARAASAAPADGRTRPAHGTRRRSAPGSGPVPAPLAVGHRDGARAASFRRTVPGDHRAGDDVAQPLPSRVQRDQQRADQVGRRKEVGDPQQVPRRRPPRVPPRSRCRPRPGSPRSACPASAPGGGPRTG